MFTSLSVSKNNGFTNGLDPWLSRSGDGWMFQFEVIDLRTSRAEKRLNGDSIGGKLFGQESSSLRLRRGYRFFCNANPGAL